MRWPLGLYKVNGDSMLPHYRHGDLLLGWRWSRPRVGRVIIARRDGKPLIKRIAKLDTDQVWVLGDNVTVSTDSRHFGPLHRSQIEAAIIARVGHY